MRELIALIADIEVGRVLMDGSGRLSFVYGATWQQTRGAHPISLSMPLAQTEHSHRVVSAFLWGLLPDNEIILQRWAAEFQVSARNPFALLSHVGEDCAGAIRFVLPARIAEASGDDEGQIKWLDEGEIAYRLRQLRADISAWRISSDEGHFSLAGAQPKTALHYDGARWGVPSGRVPTTHILKPGIGGLDAHAKNEHFCLALAHELGLPVAESRVLHFEEEVAIVVKRYDRLSDKGVIHRSHQEDICQALGVDPIKKYENDGGPGAFAIVELLRQHSNSAQVDVSTFVAALAFNWLIAGSDAHAKNYSILIGSEGRVRLAPLYDIASALPYSKLNQRKLKLAMKVGGKYRLHEIGIHEWMKLAGKLKLGFDEIIASHLKLAEEVPDLANDLLRRMKREGLVEPLLDRLADEICARAKLCADTLRGAAAVSHRASPSPTEE